jgi:hypothetical protein
MAKKRKVVSEQKRREKRLNQCPKPQFQVGDLIQVKEGVMDLDWPDLPIGGWVGRIDKAHRLLEEPKYDVTWTPETLAAAHPIYEMLAANEMLNHSQYEGIRESEALLYQEGIPILLADPGDVTHYTDRPLSSDDFIDRLRIVFGRKALETTPWLGDDGALECYYDYLIQQLTLPFEAMQIIDNDNETALTCEQLFLPDNADDREKGILCRGTDQNGHAVECPLQDVMVKDSPQKTLLMDYQIWCR